MKINSLCLIIMLITALLTSSVAMAVPTAAEITGEIERLTLNDPTNIYSGGIMIIAGDQVILPKNLLIDLPANRLSLQQIFAQAPAGCIALGESGLAKADKCNASGTGGFATLSAVHTNAGNIIAGDVLIEKGNDVVSGVVSYINYTDGYFRVNGIPGDPATGAMVRLNDPTSRHTIQQGTGCAGGPNCSADPRFGLDPDNYVSTFSTGYPFCIPSTVPRTFTDVLGLGTTTSQSSASGTGDVLCPSSNRTAALVEPPVNDSRRFAPVMVGDSINASGNYEAVNGVRFLSSHTTKILKALATQNVPTQPDYLFLQEVFLEAPGFQNQRARMLIIGFTTLAPTDVDFWSLHRDPVSNSVHEFPLASVSGCDVAAGISSCSNQGLIGAGANIFRIRYDVDFLLAAAGNPKYPGGAIDKLNPCMHLQGSARFALSNPGICNTGITLANNFGIMSPIPHEIQARTGHSLDHPGLITLDIRGNQATNGQYLFPFGINLGGVETADFLEIDVNLLNTPRIFEGIPWNLDRRLSPSGCLNGGGCEAGPLGSFALDPFPYSGLDPRTQADFLVLGLPGGTPKGTFSGPQYTNTTLSNASNRIFSYVRGTPFAGGIFNFDGNSTLLPYALGSFPADPPLISIIPAPVLNIFPPIADEDVAATVVGVPVTINVLANDFPVLGTIDLTTVAIASNPASGTVSVNPVTGAITFTPTDPLVSLVTFTYTVANNFGSISLPGTVTVTINAPPPVAGNDTATTNTITPTVINVLANDTATAPTAINPATLTVSTPSGGTAAANLDGTITYTPPVTPGIYFFTYTVRNNAPAPLTSNVATVTVTVTATPIATGVTASASPVGTQAVNSAVLITASGTGGTGSYEYRFYVNTGTGFTLVQPYSTNSTFVWIPTAAGINDFFIEARTAGTAVLRDAFTTIPGYVITATTASALAANNDSATVPANGTVIINVVANDVTTSTPINLTTVIPTAPTGGTAVANANGTVTYSAPSAPGIYAFTYTVKNSDVVPLTSNIATVTVTVTAANPATGVTAVATPVGTQTINTPVTITATGIGGTGQYEYRFYVNDGGTFYLIQPYSTSPSTTWLPGKAGVFDFFIEVRSAGSTVLRDAFANVFAYVVTSPAATGLTFNSNLSSPQAINTPITFTAQGVGGVGTYEYRFWLNSGAGFTEVQAYSTVNTYTLTPALAGVYDIFAEVRIVGSTANRDAFQEIVNYQIQ